MDNPLIFQILLVLVSLFFIFLTYMNTKTWRWVHVMFTFLVFGAAIAFCVYASLTLKTREAWIKYHDKLEKDVDQAKKDLDLVTIGDPTDVKAEVASIVNYREDIARTILDRGRVWKDCTVAPAGGSYNVTTAPAAAPADPAAPAPAARKHNLAPKAVLFAFKNGTSPEGIVVPQFYLGEFRVTAVPDDTNITLAPALPLSPEQAAAANDPAGTWTLYETCPIDGREWFTGLDKAALQALLPQASTGLDPVKYDKLLDQYVRDDQAADEATDPPDNIWIEVKFKQAHSVPVDAAAATAADADPFNTDGQAQRDRVRKAKPGEAPASVDFEPGDIATFDKETADSLIQQGIAEKVRPVFRRRLNDYELKFHALHIRIIEIDDRMRALALDLASIKAADAKAMEQEALQTAYKAKLEADLAKIKAERDGLAKYETALAARLATVKGELRSLYLSNVALSREMAALNAKLTDEINRRTAEATALNQ